MSETVCVPQDGGQLVLFEVDRRDVTVAFDGGEVVTDTGLLAIRQLDRRLGVLTEAASRLPDPRSAVLRSFTTAEVLTQTVYQLLGGYFDCDDARFLRHDPLMQVLVDHVPGTKDATLASGSTLARFRYCYTRREQQRPIEDREIDQECQQAKCERIRVLNRYLADLFVKTRTTAPKRIVLDFDATDDPVHGGQQLSLFHGYYQQHQYLPLLVFEGETGFPLGGWLRPGTAHAAWGVVEILEELVSVLRAAWPGIEILVRGDSGYALPELYKFCEEHVLKFVIGYATNAVLKGHTQVLMNYVQARAELHGEPDQRFQDIRDYQAGSWDRPRRVIAKCEVTAQGGTNRRFVVTNVEGRPADIYREIYVKRGDVPERAIEELKHGLGIDRLSSHRFFANAFAMQCHLLAYALVVLFREANAQEPEVAGSTLETLRSKLFKFGAVVKTSVRKVWFHASETWPGQVLFRRVCTAVNDFADRLGSLWQRLASPAITPESDAALIK
jgi:hypothetical protein